MGGVSYQGDWSTPYHIHAFGGSAQPQMVATRANGDCRVDSLCCCYITASPQGDVFKMWPCLFQP